jgi:hypothetical protein
MRASILNTAQIAAALGLTRRPSDTTRAVGVNVHNVQGIEYEEESAQRALGL